MRKELNFNDIHPFARHVHLLDKNIQESANDVRAYDNRLFYCISGKGTIDIDHISYPVKSGMLFLWKAGIPYHYAPDSDNPMQLLAINFDFTHTHSHLILPIPPDHTNTYDDNRQLEDVLFSDADIFNKPVILSAQNHLADKLLELNEEYQTKKKFYSQRCSGLLLNVFSHIAITGDSQTAKTNTLVDSIISYINKHYANNLSNQQLGELFGYHPNYLNQLFTRYTGESLHHYLQNIRIMHAISLLQNTDLPVFTIATKVGFHDFPHFSRYFKDKTGYAPTDFRL